MYFFYKHNIFINTLLHFIIEKYTVSQKGFPTLLIITWRKTIRSYNNFWFKLFRHNWPPNDCLIFHLT